MMLQRVGDVSRFCCMNRSLCWCRLLTILQAVKIKECAYSLPQHLSDRRAIHRRALNRGDAATFVGLRKHSSRGFPLSIDARLSVCYSYSLYLLIAPFRWFKNNNELFLFVVTMKKKKKRKKLSSVVQLREEKFIRTSNQDLSKKWDPFSKKIAIFIRVL